MRVRTGALWRSRPFLLFWAGESASLLGMQVTVLALPLFALTVLHTGPGGVGLLRAAEYLPFLVLTLGLGSWVDTHPKRPLLLVSNVSRAIVLGALFVLCLLHLAPLAVLCLFVLASGACAVVFELAYQAYVPVLAGPEHLPEGNSKLLTSQSAAEIGGPGVGGVLVQVVGVPAALLVNALTFVVSAISLSRIPSGEAPTAAMDGERPTGGVLLGFRLVFGHPYLRAFMADAATTNGAWTVFQTAWLVYMAHTLHSSAGVIGLVLAVGSVGALIGSMLATPAARHLGVGRTILGATMLDAALLAIPCAPPAGGWVVPISALAFFVNGVGWTARDVHIYSLRATLTPPALFGRMYASYRWICWGVIPLGALLGAGLADWLGLRTTMTVGAVGCALSWLWILCSPVVALREHPIPVATLPAPDAERTADLAETMRQAS